MLGSGNDLDLSYVILPLYGASLKSVIAEKRSLPLKTVAHIGLQLVKHNIS